MRLTDEETEEQQEALGIIGVNRGLLGYRAA